MRVLLIISSLFFSFSAFPNQNRENVLRILVQLEGICQQQEPSDERSLNSEDNLTLLQVMLAYDELESSLCELGELIPSYFRNEVTLEELRSVLPESRELITQAMSTVSPGSKKLMQDLIDYGFVQVEFFTSNTDNPFNLPLIVVSGQGQTHSVVPLTDYNIFELSIYFPPAVAMNSPIGNISKLLLLKASVFTNYFLLVDSLNNFLSDLNSEEAPG